jgi:hypothetical protein
MNARVYQKTMLSTMMKITTNKTQYNNNQHLMPLMILGVTSLIGMLSVVILKAVVLNVVILNVVAPLKVIWGQCCKALSGRNL